MALTETFYIIDGSAYFYRAYHAIRELATSKGFPTNAVFGFAQMLQKIVKEKEPDYLAIAFDTAKPTFRHAAYPDYKAHRPEMPEALSVQIPYIHRLVEAFKIPVVLAEGYEADDLIGSLARSAESSGVAVVIVTGDKDMLQLVSAGVSVYDSMRDRTSDEASVRERYGVSPGQLVEIMGLMGDPIDNIPGVPGIGEKTAMELIATYGSIENLLPHADQIKRKRVREALLQYGDQARLSRSLATIQTDAPVRFDPKRFQVRAPDPDALVGLCQELELTTLLKQIAPVQPTMRPGYALLDSEEKLVRWLSEMSEIQELALEPFFNEGEGPPVLEGLALATRSDRSAYLPMPTAAKWERLRALLEEEKIPKVGFDLKPAWRSLRRTGITLRGVRFDVDLADYLLNPGRRERTVESLTLQWLGKRAVGLNALSSNGPEKKKEKGVPPSTNGKVAWACERAVDLLALQGTLRPVLTTQGLIALYEQVEIPLVTILAEMEEIGILIDAERLEAISREMEQSLEASTERIYRLAKGPFNINSPKQLAEVLFDRLGMEPIRKTKTGYSTDEEVLQQLALQHPLPAEIMSYRQIMKLKSTYVDALPRMMDPATGRLHTQFLQTVTATGRLSSREPNLQNIPVRGEIGRRIRQAFRAPEHYLLLSADYNQIELRILAHLSEDPRLISSFRSGEDIHTLTACEIFGLPAESISAEMRRMAKTVNFGILYGMSPFGLATSLGVSQVEAKRYIDRYFSTYAGVRNFIDATLEQTRQTGYVTTLFHRRRYLPELTSAHAGVRGQGERLAINTPIQGSAADLIKMAMVCLDRRLKKSKGQRAKMLLQIHDELILEVPETAISATREEVREEMEGVAVLRVPLAVEFKVGHAWGDLE